MASPACAIAAQQPARLFGSSKKIRGVGRKAGAAWLRPPYIGPRRVSQRAHQIPHSRRNGLRRGAKARPSGRVRASPPARRYAAAPECPASTSSMTADRIGIGVVAIVENHDAVMHEPLAAHLAGRQRPDPLRAAAPARCRRLPPPRCRQACSITPCRPVSGLSKRVRPDAEAHAGLEQIRHLRRARRRARRQAVANRAPGMDARRSRDTRGSSAFSTAVPSAGSASISSRLARAMPSIDVEVLDVRVADIGHHADVRARDRGQLADLAGVVHPQLDDRGVRVVRHAAAATAAPRHGY